MLSELPFEERITHGSESYSETRTCSSIALVDRLSGLDASFLYFETSAHLMHVCGLLVLDSSTMPEGYSFASMRDALRRRLEGNPAFRRKLHNPFFNIDHPVWVDDEDFDIEHHVRRAAVLSPGGPKALAEVCGDIAAQPLDRSRPLWEMWIIEGVDPDAVGGGIAVMTKMHHATVDGVGGASLVSELCSIEPGSGPMSGGVTIRTGPTAPARSPDRRGRCDRHRQASVEVRSGAARHARYPAALGAARPSWCGDAGAVHRAAHLAQRHGHLAPHGGLHAPGPRGHQRDQERVRHHGQRRRAGTVFRRAAPLSRRQR